MLKDLMKSIFNEDVDLDEEFEEEEEIEETPPIEKAKPEQSKPTDISKPVQEPVVEAPDVYSKEEQEAVIKDIMNSAHEKKETPPQTLGSLDVEKVSRKDARPQRKKAYHYDRRKIQSVRPRSSNTDLEYQNVMSPIFGNTSNQKKDYKKVHDAVNLEKPLKPDVFDEVISPMFGNDLPKVKPAEKIPPKDPEVRKSVPTKAPDAMDLSEIIEKKTETEEKPKQEKLFASKN